MLAMPNAFKKLVQATLHAVRSITGVLAVLGLERCIAIRPESSQSGMRQARDLRTHLGHLRDPVASA